MAPTNPPVPDKFDPTIGTFHEVIERARNNGRSVTQSVAQKIHAAAVELTNGSRDSLAHRDFNDKVTKATAPANLATPQAADVVAILRLYNDLYNAGITQIPEPARDEYNATMGRFENDILRQADATNVSLLETNKLHLEQRERIELKKEEHRLRPDKAYHEAGLDMLKSTTIPGEAEMADRFSAAATDGKTDPHMVAINQVIFQPGTTMDMMKRWSASYVENGCNISMKMHYAVTAQTDEDKKHAYNTRALGDSRDPMYSSKLTGLNTSALRTVIKENQRDAMEAIGALADPAGGAYSAGRQRTAFTKRLKEQVKNLTKHVADLDRDTSDQLSNLLQTVVVPPMGAGYTAPLLNQHRPQPEPQADIIYRVPIYNDQNAQIGVMDISELAKALIDMNDRITSGFRTVTALKNLFKRHLEIVEHKSTRRTGPRGGGDPDGGGRKEIDKLKAELGRIKATCKEHKVPGF